MPRLEGAPLLLRRRLTAGSSADHVEQALMEACRKALGSDACVSVTVRAGGRAISKGHIDEIVLDLAGVDFEKLPVPGREGPTEPEHRGRIGTLRFEGRGVSVSGLRLARARIDMRSVDYALAHNGAATEVWFPAAEGGFADLFLSRDDIRQFAQERIPSLQGLELSIDPTGRVNASGTIKLPLLSVRGTLQGLLAVEPPSRIVIHELGVRAGAFGLPEPARRSLHEAVNPLVDVRSQLGLPVEVTLEDLQTSSAGIDISARLEGWR